MSKERVNHPDHYNAGGVECIDALASATADLTGIEAFDTANAIKYLWRWKHKNGVEDLKKAKWYIDHLIELKSPAKTEKSNPNCKHMIHPIFPEPLDALMYAQELFSVKPIMVKVPEGVDVDEFIKSITGAVKEMIEPPHKENDNMMEEFNKACLPIVDFLYKYGTPHATVMVTQADAQFSHGECGTVFKLRD